jgi:hypothetical protein
VVSVLLRRSMNMPAIGFDASGAGINPLAIIASVSQLQ